MAVLLGFSTYGQLNAVSDGSIPTPYESRSRPFEEGILFNSKDPQTVTEHQYLQSLAWINGILVYEGRTFKDVTLNFNVYEDVLLVESKRMEVDGVKSLLIDQTKIDKFFIGGDEFVSYRALTNPPMPSGFYEKYFDGERLDCYIKHKKAKYVTNEGVEYRNENQIYLLTDKSYFEYNSKKTFFTLFPEYKSELKAFFRNNSITLSKRKTEDLPRVLSYCDELISDEI